MIDINSLILLAANEKASDIHLHVGESPALRVDGSIVPLVNLPCLTPEDTKNFAKEIATEEQFNQTSEIGEVDFGFTFKDDIRIRANICKSMSNFSIVLRLLYNNMIKIDSLGFPNPEIIKNLLRAKRGLILVVGPTGCGKSTTIASMINWINDNCENHIITIEDPIEYLHKHNRCLVTQREFGSDTKSFSNALIASLRQDPNVILVGEMRDLQTISSTISAAETGHLVLATLHTTGSARTVDRIIDVFPGEQRDLVRMQLSSNLLAVISQTLCKRKDGIGRVPAFEIMIHTDAIGALIRENKSFRIQNEIQTGIKTGMITLDQYLIQLVKNKSIDKKEALSKAQMPSEMKLLLENF